MVITETLSEKDFCKLVDDAQKGNPLAIEALIHHYEPDMKKMTWFIRMSHEDSMQSLKLMLMELIQSTATPT
ncbi:helix-turn-helix domain-containing protein [Brevibacillus sp. HB2.2]|uniref:helix-turn-helix domain-containing protein n=1 Tax=Brevibacillus sp. HB2.2 TaxID=2738846 RepID=UPI00156BA313|nr:helix-turn-helix domain-containing protein [Brevibacillus sp. HB2.2]NRS47024.1 helix-turn-helix domain-containing protein [Brevibacillus sp. HB2.2]